MRPQIAHICFMDVLLIEDDPAEARLTCEAFREVNSGHVLHHITDGETAAHYLKKEEGFEHAPCPHIILLDLNLPGMNGHELLFQIKSDPVLHSIPVIVVSNSRSREDIDRVYRLHGNGYLIKPSDFDEFVLMVRSLTDFWLFRVQLPQIGSYY